MKRTRILPLLLAILMILALFAGCSAPMEKWKRDQAIPALQQWLMVLEEALACRSGMAAISPMASQIAAQRGSQELIQATQNLQKAIEYAQSNVSVAAICGWLQWALR